MDHIGFIDYTIGPALSEVLNRNTPHTSTDAELQNSQPGFFSQQM